MFGKYKYHLWLHFIILLFGLTGVLGKAISAPYDVLVFYRMSIAVLGIAVYLMFTKQSLRIDKTLKNKLLLTGILVALHWLTFFESIKQSNVSVALACFSSSTLFTALLEPVYFKKKIKPYEVVFGLIIIFALYLIFNISFEYAYGMVLSFISAFLASWFTVLNGIYIQDTSSKTISFYELLSGAIIVSVFSLGINKFSLTPYFVSVSDWINIIILALVCTSFAFIVSVEVMKKISPYTVTISVNLEPIYSIVIAVILWPRTETMSFLFYIGAGIIITTIFLNAFIKGKKSQEGKSCNRISHSNFM